MIGQERQSVYLVIDVPARVLMIASYMLVIGRGAYRYVDRMGRLSHVLIPTYFSVTKLVVPAETANVDTSLRNNFLLRVYVEDNFE